MLKDWKLTDDVFKLTKTAYGLSGKRLKLDFELYFSQNESDNFIINSTRVRETSNFGGYEPEIMKENTIFNFDKVEFKTLNELSEYFNKEIVEKHLEKVLQTAQKYIYGKSF